MFLRLGNSEVEHNEHEHKHEKGFLVKGILEKMCYEHKYAVLHFIHC